MAKNCEILEKGYTSMKGLEPLSLSEIFVENIGYSKRQTIDQGYEDIISAKRKQVGHDGPLWGFNRSERRGGYLYGLGDCFEYDGDLVELVGPTTYGTHAAFQGRGDIEMKYRANPLSQNAVGLTSDNYLTLSWRGKGADRSGKMAFIGIGFLKRWKNKRPEQVGEAVLREIVEEMEFPQLDMERVLGEIGDNSLITKRKHLERALAGGYTQRTLEKRLDGEQRQILEDYQRVLTKEIIDWDRARFLGLAYDKVNGDTTNAVFVPFNVEINKISPANTETVEMAPMKLTRQNLESFERLNTECINHTYADIELLLGAMDNYYLDKYVGT